MDDPDVKSPEAGDGRRRFLVITTLFILSRALFTAMGITFDDADIYISWQMVDPEILRTGLWRNIWYLHSQPPLFNVFVAMVLKVVPQSAGVIMHPVYLALGLGILLMMDSLMRSVGVVPALRWCVIVLTAFNPNFVLVEHWSLYSHPLTAMLCFAAWLWVRAFRARSIPRAVACFAVLCAIILSRSLFHPVWYAVLGAFAVGLFPQGRRRRLALLLLLALTPALGWYAKNKVMFGFFGSSSWLGMSLAKQTTFQLTEEERAALIAEGRLHPTAAVIPFSRYSHYRDMIDITTKSGVPIMDNLYSSTGAVNFNHHAMLDLSSIYRKDALRTLRERPLRCLSSQIDAWDVFFETTSIYEFLGENRAEIMPVENFYSRFIYLQREYPLRDYGRGGTVFSFHLPTDRRLTSWTLVAMFLGILLAGVPLIIRRFRAGGDPVAGATLLFLWLNIMYVSFIPNLLETGENNRFRFLIEPFMWVFTAALLSEIARTAYRRFGGGTEPVPPPVSLQ